jgi:hypothetical protein
MFSDHADAQEFLKQLANKLATSSHQLSEAARRLHLAELTYREYLARLRKLDEQMRQLLDLLRGSKEVGRVSETNPTFCKPPTPGKPKRKLRYSDYIELSNYAELKKFEKMGKITDREVERFDADALLRKLIEDEPAK